MNSGNPAYNASKAAVKSLTESLSHELRSRPQANVTAHLFMYVFRIKFFSSADY
jgi:NAD(P)-dependent dehydrogenase (short-subunit alcohol dehydrogenase family)